MDIMKQVSTDERVSAIHLLVHVQGKNRYFTGPGMSHTSGYKCMLLRKNAINSKVIKTGHEI